MKVSTSRWLRLVVIGLLGFCSHQVFADPAVQELIVKTKDGVRVDTLVMYPKQSSEQPFGVVVMNHGFLMSNSYYRQVLALIAIQGFVVIAPQTIPPGGLPIGKPSTEKEAQYTAEVVGWMSTHARTLIGHEVDFNNLALVNHSRGGKIAWTMVRDGLIRPKAIAAIDPVDGTQDGTALTTSGMSLKFPVLILGTGLGGKSKLGAACAPANSNYQVFWKTVVQSPSWLFVANDYGHMDFYDDGINCGLTCSVCVTAAKNKSHSDLRSWMGTTIGAFLRGVVLGDALALESLEDNPLNLSLTSEQR